MNKNLHRGQFDTPELPGMPAATPDRSVWHYTTEDEWDSSRRDPAHVGTQKASMDIGMNVHRPSSHDEGSLHRLELSAKAPMLNTPDRPVTDEFANEAFGGPAAYDPNIDHLPTFDRDYMDKRGDLNAGGSGVYYRNAAEDPGSISAVVTRPDQNLSRQQSFRVIPATVERDVPSDAEAGLSSGTRSHLPWQAQIAGKETRVVTQDRLFDTPMQHKLRRVGEPRLERFR